MAKQQQSPDKATVQRTVVERLENQDAQCWPYRKARVDRVRELRDCCEQILVENCYRATRAYRYASHYQGYTLTNLSSFGADVSVSAGTFQGLDSPLIKNRLPQLCKAFVSKSFANDSPRPQFTTKGGDYEQILKAETLDDLIMAEFEEDHGAFSNIDEMHRMGALIASSSTGSYAVWCIDYQNLTRPECELDDTLTMGIFRAQRYGAIRMVVRTVWMMPEEAVQRFGTKFRDAIYENLEPRTATIQAGVGIVPDLAASANVQIKRREVRVHMGWLMQVGSAVGWQTFTLKDGETVLRDRQYRKRKPPMAMWHYEPELGGEWGTPLTQHVYLLSRYQNRILNDVDTAERKTAQVLIAVQAGTEGAKAVKAAVLNSLAVQVIETNGPVDSAMKVFEGPKFSKDSLALEAVYDNAQYEDTGIPRNHAMGGPKAAGQSGIHESLMASYYTENFADAERRSIRMRAIDCTFIILWVLQALAKDGFERWAGDKKTRRLVKSQDLDLDDDKYVTEIKAVGEGKDSPSTRLEKAEKWLLNPAVPFQGPEMVEMMKTFDVKRAEQEANAVTDFVDEQVQRWRKAPQTEMVKPTFYLGPERWWQIDGLKRALSRLTFEFLNARRDGVPEDRLNWFIKYGNDCTALIQDEEARLAALQNGGGEPPMQQQQQAPPPPAPAAAA
jgi:hypothetical protein